MNDIRVSFILSRRFQAYTELGCWQKRPAENSLKPSAIRTKKGFTGNVSNTNVSNTNVSNTNVSNTNVSNTNVSNTNVSNTNVSNTNVSNTNVSNNNYQFDTLFSGSSG